MLPGFLSRPKRPIRLRFSFPCTYPGLAIRNPPRLALPALCSGCPVFRQLLCLPPVHEQPSPPPEVSRIIKQRHLDCRETEVSGFVRDGIHDADQRLVQWNIVKSIGRARYPFGHVCRDQVVDLALGRTREIEAHFRPPPRLPRRSPASCSEDVRL